MQGVLHIDQLIRHIADLIVPCGARAGEGEVELAEFPDIVAQVHETPRQFARVPCRACNDGDDADEACDKGDDKDMVRVIVQILHLTGAYLLLDVGGLFKETVYILCLLIELAPRSFVGVGITALIRRNDTLGMFVVFMYARTQLLAELLAVRIDGVLRETSDLILRFL